MNKNESLKWINLFLALSIFFQIISGFTMTKFGISFLYSFHDANGWLVLFFVLLHIVNNWSWIKINLLPKREEG